jgi:hypothetical protein
MEVPNIQTYQFDFKEKGIFHQNVYISILGKKPSKYQIVAQLTLTNNLLAPEQRP